jgi:hypothetical protein
MATNKGEKYAREPSRILQAGELELFPTQLPRQEY